MGTCKDLLDEATRRDEVRQRKEQLYRVIHSLSSSGGARATQTRLEQELSRLESLSDELQEKKLKAIDKVLAWLEPVEEDQ